MAWILGVQTINSVDNWLTINKDVLSQKQLSQENYIAVLEKTNESLSMRFNPYWVIVWTLSALFTLWAIVAAIMIFRQSADYKRQLNENRKNYENNLKKFLDWQEKIIQEKNEKYESIWKELESLITKYETELGSTASKGKKVIQKQIDELKREKEKIMAQTYIPTVDLEENFPWLYAYKDTSLIDSLSIWIDDRKLKTCNYCWKQFYVKWVDKYSITISTGKAKCPHCLRDNYI